MPINPAFHRHPIEAAIIGRLVVSFGELEVTVAQLAAEVVGARDQIMRLIYSIRSTSSRITTAGILLRDAFKFFNLVEDFDEAQCALRECLTIRNRYAHCHWLDAANDISAGLFFTDLQETAVSGGSFSDFACRHLDVNLLNEQDKYFTYCLELLTYLRHELALRRKILRISYLAKADKSHYCRSRMIPQADTFPRG